MRTLRRSPIKSDSAFPGFLEKINPSREEAALFNVLQIKEASKQAIGGNVVLLFQGPSNGHAASLAALARLNAPGSS
jgi:hypothetical protein